MKRKVRGSLIITAGYILSPLSWWNDLFVNIPIAYVFAFLFGFVHRGLFAPMLILGYWITNVAGFVMMHYGFKSGFTDPDNADSASAERISKVRYTKNSFYRDLAVSLVYTLIVAAFVKMGWLKFPMDLQS